jgi:hypothetical protein
MANVSLKNVYLVYAGDVKAVNYFSLVIKDC